MKVGAVIVLACHAEAWSLLDWAFQSATEEERSVLKRKRAFQSAPEEKRSTAKASVLKRKKRRRLDGHVCENTAGWFKCGL